MSSPCTAAAVDATASPPPHPPSLAAGAAPEQLHAQLWRASSLGHSASPCVPSGFAALDAELPGGGWPTRALSEILLPRPALLEWRLLAPALRGLVPRQSAASTGRRRRQAASAVSAGKPLLLINPPLVPHLAGLQACGIDPAQLVWIRAETPQQQLWAAEQAIKSNAAAAIVAWLPQARPEQIRRLQTHALAAESPVFVLRPQRLAQAQSSAAPLRVAVEAQGWALRLRIVKRRGPVFEGTLELPALPTDLARVLTPRMLAPRPSAASMPSVPLPFPHPADLADHALARPAPQALASP